LYKTKKQKQQNKNTTGKQFLRNMMYTYRHVFHKQTYWYY